MNTKFTKRYQQVLKNFKQSPPPITQNYEYFLAGFIEGEGSLCASVKQTGETFKVDPEFNIAQHESGVVHLIGIMHLFKTGNIGFNSGSQATYVYKMTNRKALKEKFVPYYKKYVWPYACETKRYTFQQLCKILNLFEQKEHLKQEGLALKILPIVYQMNSSKGKERKWKLEDLQAKILDS
uniref:Homing endonuclease LAGLIDADG domain-containing protein n=1 Tax=Pseudochlorodesmis sp. HV01306a TaxID=2358488 RepID=A0A386AXW0_9CHLO|nr:hypothetical protein [Pseudochlorodesmis sp. HV01306a]